MLKRLILFGGVRQCLFVGLPLVKLRVLREHGEPAGRATKHEVFSAFFSLRLFFLVYLLVVLLLRKLHVRKVFLKLLLLFVDFHKVIARLLGDNSVRSR